MRRVLYSDVQVNVQGTGSHETIYGEVRTYDGSSLNAELVRVGLATWAKTYAPHRTDIADLESKAREAHRGIWGDENGLDVELPATPPPRRPPAVVRSISAPVNSIEPSPPSRAAAILATPTPAVLRPVEAASSPHTGIRSSIAALRSRGGRLEKKAERSAYRAPFLGSIVGSAILGGIASFIAQIALARGYSSRRTPFQAAVSVEAAIAAGLLAPLPYLACSHMFQFGKGSILSIFVPPLIALCGWSSVVLCRREQILRAAPFVALSDLLDRYSDLELVKTRGTALGLAGPEPFVSQIGRIPAVYLREISYSYDAVQSETYYSARKRGGRRSTRYGWTIIHNETSQGDFLVADANGSTATVCADQASYLPLRIARFYNGVPVETWFSRPYPGDTRTEIQFIAPDAPVVVWGRPRRTLLGAKDSPSISIGNAHFQNTLVVEGDEARIWTRRPIVGLLLTLLALGLTLILVYGLSTPGAWVDG